MNRIVAVGIKMFLSSFAGMAGINWLMSEEVFRFPIVYGIIMGSACMFNQRRSDRDIEKLGARPKNGAVQAKTIELSLSPEEAFNRVKAIFNDMPAIMELTTEGYSLKARRCVDGTGWGERITVDCTPGPMGTTVHFTSRSIWRLHFREYAENQLNVERISRQLTELANQRALA